MFCPKCGASIPDDSAYCPNCGRHVKDAFDSIRKYSPNPAQRTGRLAYLLSPSGWFAFRGRIARWELWTRLLILTIFLGLAAGLGNAALDYMKPDWHDSYSEGSAYESPRERFGNYRQNEKLRKDIEEFRLMFQGFLEIMWLALFTLLYIRRLHDLGSSGWILLLILVCGGIFCFVIIHAALERRIGCFLWVIILASLIIGCRSGDKGPNRYGPDPLGKRF